MEGTISRFLRYVNCSSESHNEKRFCEFMEQELTDMGIRYERQYLGSDVVTDGWNILARVAGRPDAPEQKPFLFVFHLDTVAPGNNIQAFLADGKIQSQGKNVLGADGKLAIAVVLEAISRLKAAGKINRPMELLFTVCQESGLLGAHYADFSKIRSEEAVIIDHYVTGEVLLHTPALLTVNVELIGQSSHVIRAEDPATNALTAAVEIIHQIPTGRIRDDLSINVFDLVSLSQSNAVPGYARFDLEARSFGAETLAEVRKMLSDIITGTAQRLGCSCNYRERLRVPEADYSQHTDILSRLRSIYDRSGVPMVTTRSFGVMDSVWTNLAGIRSVPIGFSIHRSHSAHEYVLAEDIRSMLELAENIIQYF